MKEVNELFPTEGLLILDMKATTGQQLLVKTIEELLLLGIIGIETKQIEKQQVAVICEKDFTSPYLQDYHIFFLTSIREHYQAYAELTVKNALTPKKLIGSVQYGLNFNDNRYKFKHIYDRLNLWGLARNKFPHYYMNRPLTKKGEEVKGKLKELLHDLELEINVRKDNHRLKELCERLGFNIILIPGAFKKLGQIEFDKTKYFAGPEPEILDFILQWEIFDSVNLEIPELELFDLPGLDD